MKYSHSPAWTFAGRYKADHKDTIPGPAAYQPERTEAKFTPTWKIGTSIRPDLDTNDKSVPGPGSYDPLERYHVISGSKFHPSKNDAKAKLNQTSPGPGQYSPSPSRFKKYYGGYYMASKNVPAEKGADIPGPGSYEPYRTGLNKQSVKIGHEKRLFTYNTEIPGPGCTSWNYSAYNVSRPFSAGANGPKAVFTREDRMKLTGVDINQLGPGQYNYQSVFAKTGEKGYSISGKSEMKSTEVGPGPGAYSPRSIDKPFSPVITMGMRTQAISSKAPNTPGPGEYIKTEPNGIYASRQVKIGTEQRKPLMYNANTPGPAAYKISAKTEGPKYSLHGAKQPKSTDKIPGPGQYEPKVDYVKVRPTSAKIGHSKRNETRRTVAPGPGAYHLSESQEGPKWGFGKGMRNTTGSDAMPGPGQYQIPSTIAQVASYALGKSTSSKFMSR